LSNILDGKKLSEEIKQEISLEVKQLQKKDITPTLVVILVGDDSASHTYVNAKKNACESVSINSQVYKFDANVEQSVILDKINSLNKDDNVDGILVQLPLPKHINEHKIINAIDPKKDVDGFHPDNVGRLSIGMEGFAPATPYGIIKLLNKYNIDLKGKKCIIVGASNIVGKPLSIMLTNMDATVCVCNIFTKDLKSECLSADILFSATGVIHLIKEDMVKEGAIVVDVGINKDENGKLVGDVDFEKVSKKCSYITPVPGGVGPMTIAMLLVNTLKSAKNKGNTND